MSSHASSNSDPDETPVTTGGILGPGSVSYAGLIMILFTVIIFATTAYRILKNTQTLDAKLSVYIPELILCGIGVFSAVLGVSLLRAGGLASVQPNRVINKAEWESICDEVKSGNEEPVTQYIRLTSLTGFSGNFTKLGLSGLPLATIALTLFFSLMFLQNTAFLDLAKLTLGAFIGSFVQKQVSSQGSGSVKLPGGEKVSFTPNSLA